MQDKQSCLPAPTAHQAHRQADGFLMENAMSQPEESGLERDYCAGQLSLRDLAEIHGISEGQSESAPKTWLGTQGKGRYAKRYAGTQKRYAKIKSAYQRM